jgi:hypothetical protein
MPDLKSEMSKVLDAWEHDDQQTQEKQVQNTLPQIFKPTNNVSRETFNYVRDNPNKTSGEICVALELRGFRKNSVGSLLTQFLKQQQMARDHNGRFSTAMPSYTPLKSTKKYRATGARTSKVVQIKSKPKSAGIAALHVDTKAKVKPSWDVDTVLDTMSIVQARTLYDALKKIFGG